MCSHVYLWCIWTTWRCKPNTAVSDIWAPEGRPGGRGAGLQFGLATAQQEPPPSLSAVMWTRHSSLWRQHNYSWMNTVSLRPHFCCWKMQLLISCAAFPLKKEKKEHCIFLAFSHFETENILNMSTCNCLMDKLNLNHVFCNIKTRKQQKKIKTWLLIVRI